MENKYKLVPHEKYEFYQIKPTPTPDEIARFYADEFYAAGYPKFNDSSLEVQMEDQEFHDSHRQDMCDTIETITGKLVAGMQVLDIGCGWGQALHYFRKAGMECYGFDPSPEAVEFGKKIGLNIVHAGLSTMKVFPQKFDVVTLLNVLEHLADPVQVLSEIEREILKPGGVIIIDVPNEFNPFQVAGQKTHGLPEWWVAPPGHLNYFSAETLAKLLEGCGFKVHTLESSFPLEMFLLFGRNYVKDSALGKQSHKERVAFELNLRKNGKTKLLRDFYQSLAHLNLGRQVIAFAVKDSK